MTDVRGVDVDDPTEADAARDVIGDVVAASAAADGNDPVDEAALRQLHHHGLGGTSLWLAGDDGQDGFAWRRGGDLDVVVRPSARGRGLGTDLSREATAQPGPLAAWSHGDDPAARRIADTLGFTADRALWVMRRPLTDLPALAVPSDIIIRGYQDADAGDVLRINAAAFAHHPEQGSMDAEELAERMAEAWFEPAGLLIAVDDATGEALGFHWTKRHSATQGEVYVVGIAPAAQGRGLGKALTLAGLHHLADAGCTSVLLYVESDNAPARAVYAGLGFTHAAADTHVQYHR